MEDPYAVLEVEPGAPVDQVKKAYRRLARQWHPDRNAEPEAEKRFREVASAWEILGDPERRLRHDVRVGAIARGDLPEEFIEDVADAIERAERWIREGVLPHYAGFERGAGAEMAARLQADLEELSIPHDLGEAGFFARRTAQRLNKGLFITAWLRPAHDATVMVRGQGFWEISVVPRALWDAGFRTTATIDDAVMRLLLARTAQVVAAGRIPGEMHVDDARAIDDANVRRRNLRWGGWAAVAVVLGALFLSGYNQW